MLRRGDPDMKLSDRDIQEIVKASDKDCSGVLSLGDIVSFLCSDIALEGEPSSWPAGETMDTVTTQEQP